MRGLINMHKLLGMAVALGLMGSGCIQDGGGDNNPSPIDPAVNVKTSATYAVVIGMENSKFAGACPGAKLDSDRMYSLISKYAQSTVLLQDSNATRATVRRSIENAVAKFDNGLFILYYSGHGGSGPFPDTGIEETDGRDEYLCLYDNYFRDNEIWSLISKCKGRVWICIDACHSRTMFRNSNITFLRAIPLTATWHEDGVLPMQCWSGCPDDTYSYGSSTGGQFTNTLLKYYKDSLTYDELWKKIEEDGSLKRYETVQRTIMGADFSDLPVFR